MKHIILTNILLLIGVVYIFCCCNSDKITYSDNSKTYANYSINHYIDTIHGHVIITTVADYSKYGGGISCSTLEIDNFSKTDNN